MYYLLLGANMTMVGSFALKFGSLPPQIPLFYSRPKGEDQLAIVWFIFLLPLIMNLLFFTNLYIYKKLFISNDFVKKMFEYLNIFLIASSTFIFLKIILLIS